MPQWAGLSGTSPNHLHRRPRMELNALRRGLRQRRIAVSSQFCPIEFTDHLSVRVLTDLRLVSHGDRHLTRHGNGSQMRRRIQRV